MDRRISKGAEFRVVGDFSWVWSSADERLWQGNPWNRLYDGSGDAYGGTKQHAYNDYSSENKDDA